MFKYNKTDKYFHSIFGEKKIKGLALGVGHLFRVLLLKEFYKKSFFNCLKL